MRFYRKTKSVTNGKGDTVMKTETGNQTVMQKMAGMFKVNDVVTYIPAGNAKFYGMVTDVMPGLAKVMVSWAGQKPTQHCPDELMLLPEELRKTKAEDHGVKVASMEKTAEDLAVESAMIDQAPAFDKKSIETMTTCIQALQIAADAELTAASGYWKAMLYFHAISLDGLSNWAKNEAEEEVDHSIKVLNVLQTLGSSDEAPRTLDAGSLGLPNGLNWENPKHVADDILAMEKFVLSVYVKMSDIAKAANDPFVEKFAQDMIETQTAAVDKALRINQKIDGACAWGDEHAFANMVILDSIIGDGIPFELTASARRVASSSDIHGIEKPRGGGFSIMQDLQKDLHEEAEVGGGKTASRRASISRTALYWTDKGRVYRMTRGEMDGKPVCPKCKGPMDKQPFTNSDKILVCTKCTFKIPTSSIVTSNPSISIETDEDGTKIITIE
jgi:ferritin